VIFLRNYYVTTTQKTDILVISHDVKRAVRESGIQSGAVHIIVPGATAGVTLLENDPKIYEGLKNWVETQVPASGGSRPTRRSGSGRDDAHLRAALIGPTLTLPLQDGKLMVGPWQEVVLFDFDDSKIGRREFTVQVMGEPPGGKN
jgi:secondary thiamine-phosphate synthase enzyme